MSGTFWATYRSAIATRRDQQVLTRYSAHGAMLVLVVAALMLAQIHMPVQGEEAGRDFSTESGSAHSFLAAWAHGARADEGYLVRAVVPFTARSNTSQMGAQGGVVFGDLSSGTQFESREFRALKTDRPRQEIQKYTVQAGDSVYRIAERFGISPESIVWANEKKLGDNPDSLSIGDELLIPPVSGVVHEVQKNDTLEKIAKSYKVDPSVIVAFIANHITDSSQLTVGKLLMVPGGVKPEPVRQVAVPVRRASPQPQPSNRAAPAAASTLEGAQGSTVVGSGTFQWPTTGVITQKYWSRHPAIDIGAPKGTPVYAADSGTVIEAGWSPGGYGYTVVIDHGNGYQTRYAHLSWFNPNAGQTVEKGELIGQVGNTGRSSGPHLHFEIILNGGQLNPFGFLP